MVTFYKLGEKNEHFLNLRKINYDKNILNLFSSELPKNVSQQFVPLIQIVHVTLIRLVVGEEAEPQTDHGAFTVSVSARTIEPHKRQVSSLRETRTLTSSEGQLAGKTSLSTQSIFCPVTFRPSV